MTNLYIFTSIKRTVKMCLKGIFSFGPWVFHVYNREENHEKNTQFMTKTIVKNNVSYQTCSYNDIFKDEKTNQTKIGGSSIGFSLITYPDGKIVFKHASIVDARMHESSPLRALIELEIQAAKAKRASGTTQSSNVTPAAPSRGRLVEMFINDDKNALSFCTDLKNQYDVMSIPHQFAFQANEYVFENGQSHDQKFTYINNFEYKTGQFINIIQPSSNVFSNWFRNCQQTNLSMPYFREEKLKSLMADCFASSTNSSDEEIMQKVINVMKNSERPQLSDINELPNLGPSKEANNKLYERQNGCVGIDLGYLPNLKCPTKFNLTSWGTQQIVVVGIKFDPTYKIPQIMIGRYESPKPNDEMMFTSIQVNEPKPMIKKVPKLYTEEEVKQVINNFKNNQSGITIFETLRIQISSTPN